MLFQIPGCEHTVRLALERGELNLSVFSGTAVTKLFDKMTMLQRATTIFTDNCLTGLTAIEERCRTLAIPRS